MEEIIEAISKLIPFEKLGLPKEIAEPLSIIVLTILASATIYVGKRIKDKHQKLKECINSIKPQFDHAAIKKAKQYYIPTQYQNASPTRQEEPGFTHQYIARQKLIPFFIEKAFDQEKDSERFYLILADSGMGKTTFMVNLFLKYNSHFNRRRDLDMKLFRFSDPDTMSIINQINTEQAKKTILLLDALDEDKGIVSNSSYITDEQAFRNRIDEIIQATKNFAEVIITCRTQYFPGQEDDPYELKIKRPDEKGFYVLNKLYISPFTNAEVKLYLKKKYGWLFFINREKKIKAEAIVKQSANLVVRPMLLSYIDYLIDGNATGKTAFEVYEILVIEWLKRESEKRKSLSDRFSFSNNLRSLSQQIAVKIYNVWQKDNRLYLTKEEIHEITKQYNFSLSSQEVTGQSLLTCDGSGNWKFAHKSILEFFLAEEVIQHPSFLSSFNFGAMKMSKKFYYESDQSIIKKGLYLIDFPKDGFSSDDIEVQLMNFGINMIKFPEREDIFGSKNLFLNFFSEKLFVGYLSHQAFMYEPDYLTPPYFETKCGNKLLIQAADEVIHFCNLLNDKYEYPIFQPSNKTQTLSYRGFRPLFFKELFAVSALLYFMRDEKLKNRLSVNSDNELFVLLDDWLYLTSYSFKLWCMDDNANIINFREKTSSKQFAYSVLKQKITQKNGDNGLDKEIFGDELGVAMIIFLP